MAALPRSARRLDITVSAEAPRRGGRPSRAASEQLGERILEVATELFLSGGYGATSIEMLADRAGIAKRTFYHRFPDKRALFAAVLQRITNSLRPADGVSLFEGDTIEAVLDRLARIMVRAAVTPSALALYRLLVAESRRFPELAAALAEEGSTAEVIQGVAAQLEIAAAAGHIKVRSAEFAAAQFLQLVVAVPQRRALGFGAAMTEDELDSWASHSVRFFLDACRI